MKNNDNQYTIYLRSTNESVPVSKEEFDAYYHDIDLYRRKQQRHGKCVCPRSKRLACDMDCWTCPFYRAGDVLSLDYTEVDEEGNELAWIDEIPDNASPFDEVVAETYEAKAILARISELMPEAITIGELREDGRKDVDIAKEIGIKNTTFAMRLKKLKSTLEKEFPDFFQNR